jgi:hypothetical protein
MTVADVKEQILGNTGGAADEPDTLDVDDGSGLSEDIAVVDAMNTSQPASELGGQLS